MPAGVLEGAPAGFLFSQFSMTSLRRTLALIGTWTISLGAVHAEAVKVSLQIDESKAGPAIPADFLGFSYEKNVLALDHFKPSNTAMVNLMRHLGSGVLRFGANYVEITRWEPDAAKSFSNQKSVIGTRELEELYHFARDSRWTVIHGLNLGANDPQMAASEAAEAQRIGGKPSSPSKSATNRNTTGKPGGQRTIAIRTSAARFPTTSRSCARRSRASRCAAPAPPAIFPGLPASSAISPTIW